MPLTGLSLNEVFWQLPAAVAYQFQLVYLQMQGCDIVIEKSSAGLLARLKKAKATHRG
jgi:hypothetical protein